MVMAVISRDQANHVLEVLVTSGYPVTFTESRGGMWRQAQYTLYTCVAEEAVDDMLRIIRENCRAQVEVETDEAKTAPQESIQTMADLGGAVVFVWDIERLETY
jgi:uncharacterized protein YaaQ